MKAELEFKPMVYEVKSESDKRKKYLVTNYRPNHFSCTCRDFIFRSHDSNGYATNHKCKHIKKIIAKLEGDT